jgi:hypothetical protein
VAAALHRQQDAVLAREREGRAPADSL